VLFWVWVCRVRGRDVREEGIIQYSSDRGTGKRGGRRTPGRCRLYPFSCKLLELRDSPMERAARRLGRS